MNVLIKILRHFRHNELSFLNPFWVMLGRIFRFVILKTNIKTSVPHYIGQYGPFKLDIEFAFSNFSKWGKGHNNGFSSCVEASRNCKCFLDIGGHIGLITLPVAKMINGNGLVYTFEPAKKNLEHLKSHIKNNYINNVIICDELVGDEVKDQVVFFERNIASGQNALAIKGNISKYHKTIKSQTTIDSYCSEKSIHPEIIKIDVEGAEWFVINGARKTLKKYRPKIYLSIHPRELKLFGKSVKSLMILIKECEYGIYSIDGFAVDEPKLEEYLLLPNG